MGLRLFVAVDLPPAIAAEVKGLCQGLAAARWTNPAQLHLTLRFLGDTPEADLPGVKGALGTIAVAPFELGVRGVGVFPKHKRPARVLWAGLEVAGPDRTRKPAGSRQASLEPLVALKEAIDRALGPDPEQAERGFTPHLTLARFRDDPGRELATYLERHAAFTCAGWPVDAFHLYRSHLGSDGARHEVLQSYPLRAP
jgi:RNA 2',3'-cyclic 3'-phosphodiesterase